jgi:phosphoribosylaminoimidazole-succinocarboxamide synthase
MAYSRSQIEAQIPFALTETHFSFATKLHVGKVRDTYEYNGNRFIVTTDRQSAFDRILSAIPFKGQVLNQLSAFWFEQTKDIIPNHLIAVPDPNVSVVKTARVFPVEIIIRAYITGTTSTSAWINYQKGVRDFCGVRLEEGLKKNQQFSSPIITPTTKPETGHDESISPDEILNRGYMTKEQWEYISEKALALFARGQAIAKKGGLLLVDTKYEFGVLEDGTILLVDEIHTPDSSRFWEANSYDESFRKGEDPKSFDKDVLRRWYNEHCNPYEDEVLPPAPTKLIVDLSETYISAYEKISGKEFSPEISKERALNIENGTEKYLRT